MSTKHIYDFGPERAGQSEVRHHNGAMTQPLNVATSVTLDRINLRLSAETFAAIDDARGTRPGNISRNSWIAEAIEEKLGSKNNPLETRRNRAATNA